MNEMEVPEGWEKKFLKDVFCQKNLKWVPNQSEKKLNYVGLENIESNSGRLVMFKPTESNQIKSSKTVFSKDDILYGKLRPYLNKVLIPDFDGVCSTDILVLQPKKGMNKKFIWYFLKSSNVLNPISKITFGSKMPRTKIQDLEKISILVPSETLQKKIVKKLDILFVQLNNKKKEINDLNQNVVYSKITNSSKKHFLKLAFTGELTKKWRKNHSKIDSADCLLEDIVQRRRRNYAKELKMRKSKNLRIFKSKFLLDIPKIDTNNDDLPKSWTVTNIDFLAYVTKLAGFEYSKYMKPQNYIEQKINDEVPLIRAQNVHMGKFDNNNVKFISKTTSDILERSQVHGNEILMVSIGDVGNVCLAPTDQRWHLAPNVAKIEVDGIDREYLYYYLQSPFGIAETLSRIKKTAQPSLSAGNTRLTNVHLAPLKEQEEIIKLIKQKFALIDSFKKQIDELHKKQEKTIKLLDAIQFSVLRNAFSGKLVN